jgi:hypothetical protein
MRSDPDKIKLRSPAVSHRIQSSQFFHVYDSIVEVFVEDNDFWVDQALGSDRLPIASPGSQVEVCLRHHERYAVKSMK